MTAHIRANEVLKRFTEVKGPIRGAEIGVEIGKMSECLLQDPRVTLLMVDSWAAEDKQPKHYLAAGDYHAHLTHEQQRAHRETAERVTEFAGERHTIARMTSLEASQIVDDGFFDFVFIDADHSMEGCLLDLDSWWEKVKDGGYLCGHDYGYLHTPGVKKAVDMAAKRYGWTLELGENYTWFVRMGGDDAKQVRKAA